MPTSYFYAVGGNEKATKLSGINTEKVYCSAYLNMGFLAAVIFDVVSKKEAQKKEKKFYL